MACACCTGEGGIDIRDENERILGLHEAVETAELAALRKRHAMMYVSVQLELLKHLRRWSYAEIAKALIIPHFL